MSTSSTENIGSETCGCYVYGVVGSADGQPTLGLPPEGIDPAFPVYTLPWRRIQAVVSKVSLCEFGPRALEMNLRDFSWLARKARAHEQTLEAVQEHCSVIPMQLCVIFSSEDRVREMLVEYHDLFVENLARLKGKHEWGVKVYVNTAVLRKRLGEVSDQIRALTEEMATKTGGTAYVWKKRLENAAAGEMERICDQYAQHGHDRLQCHAGEACLSHLSEGEGPEGPETMILNGVYLLTEEQRSAFCAEFADLQQEYGAFGLRYQLSGPWPPYNFVSNIGKPEKSSD